MKFTVKNWFQIGVRSGMSTLLKKQIILANRISWTTLPLLLVSGGIALFNQEYHLALGFVSFCILILGTLGLNFFHKVFISRLILSILPTLITIFFPVTEIHETEHYSAVLFGSVIFCVYPFLLIDYHKEKEWFIVISILNLGFIMAYDIIYCTWIEPNGWQVASWLSVKIPQAFMFLVLASGFVFLQKMNMQYENHLHKINQSLGKSHQELAHKNSQIEEQKNKIVGQNQEIIRQNKLLIQQTEYITEKNHALETSQETIKQNKEEIQAILETLAVRETEMTAVLDAIYIHAPITEFNLEGKILNVSYKTAELFGVERQDLIGKNIAEFNRHANSRTAKDVKEVQAFWQEVVKGKAQTRETDLFVNDKIIHFTETFAPILNRKGQPHKIISVGQDVTELRQQKNKIEKQNIRIGESIRAALTIQQAMLPDKSRMQALLHDYFIIYSPKDVVSGDFYRIDQVRDTILLTVADCTGHGVPGAFMTMIGSLLLNEIIHMNDVAAPAQILWALHESVKVALRQHETGDPNGMDLGILAIQKKEGSDTKLVFAGAKHSLTCVRTDGELQILKGTRKSIGGRQNERKQFQSQVFTPPKGSMVYLTTDGFVDQNSAINHDRFGRQRLRDLLIKNASKPVVKQKEELENRLSQYMNGVSQRDDILLIGVRI